MANNSFEEIWEKLKGAKNVLLSLHLGPDGDSLGSCVSMKYVLERDLDISVDLVSRDSLDSMLSALPYAQEVDFGKGLADVSWDEYDLVMALDSGVHKQIMPEDFTVPDMDKFIVIDHHATNPGYGGMNYVELLCSNCSILLKMFRHLNIEIDSELATRLLLGIYTDTRGFAHSADAVGEAAFLIEKGAHYIDGVVKPIIFNFPLNLKKFYALNVDRLDTHEINGKVVGGSCVSYQEIERLGLNLSEARGAVNDLQTIGGIDVLFTLTDMGDYIKGSFRSTRGVDVSKFAVALGGGGHKVAAAFKIEGMSLEEARAKLFETVEQVGYTMVDAKHTGR